MTELPAVLDGCWKIARGWVAGAHEGPGALVDERTWQGAVRTLADALLDRPLAAQEGLTEQQQQTLALLQTMRPAEPVPWSGRPLVVVGCGRSGTTWLERMLMASPQAGGVDGAESFLFEQLGPLWTSLPDHPPLREAVRTFCDTVLGTALARHSPGADVFVEKTPLHVFQLPQISSVYPTAAFVHVVRDGRDVSRSISQVDFFRLPDPADAAALWVRVLDEVRRQAPTLTRFREVRYEQLLADPVGRLTELLTWLGLSANLRELEERAGTRVSTHAGLGQAVGSATWHALTPSDQARVYGECGAVLRREGYATRRDVLAVQWRLAYWRRVLQRRRRPLAS